MKKIIRLTEFDLTRIVKRVIRENNMIFEETHDGMSQIAKQLKPYGYKQETVGTNSVWKGDETNGSGVVYWKTENKFKVYKNGALYKTYELSKSNNYDSSDIVSSVVSILKKL
jgi:ABC-type branched-subunit amino acid transport system substrate-binding protein